MVRLNRPLLARIAQALTYASHGKPSEVLALTSLPLPDLGPNDVSIKILAATVNPSDINQLEGTYPIKPALPAVGGNEGVGEIERIGKGVKSLAVGDRVIPAKPGFGTWRTLCVTDENSVKRIPKMSVVNSAMLAVNPCTAYRMLEDFNKPNPGDWVIQNGANSAVGRAVIQVCKIRGYKTINIIRNKPDDDVRDELLSIGADIVFDDKEDMVLSAFCSTIPPPTLGLNMVSGRATIPLLKALGENGSLVTYGAMSRMPMSVPFGLTVFKNITLHSYWMTKWTKEHGRSEREYEMYSEIAEWCNSGELVPPPYQERKLREFGLAMEDAFSKKQVFHTGPRGSLGTV